MAKKAVNEAMESAEKADEENTKVEQKYLVNKLREKSILLFGVSQSTFDGAMYGHAEQEYTIDEAQAIINEWLYGRKEGKK